MSAKLIATIYFYVISAASLALIVVGIFNIVNLTLNVTQYDKYPLRYRNDNCDTYPYMIDKPPPPVPVADQKTSTPSAQDLARQKQQCEASLEKERKQTKLDDIKNSLTFTTVGLLLFLIHFPLARKQSQG